MTYYLSALGGGDRVLTLLKAIILSKHSEVFTKGLETLHGYKAKICADDQEILQGSMCSILLESESRRT